MNNLRFNVSEETKMRLAFFASLLVLMAVMALMAHAAGTDDTFQNWVDEMTGWIKGSLGKGVSIAFIVVGIIMGITRQSLMSFAVGIGAALGLLYTPDVINNMFTAML